MGTLLQTAPGLGDVDDPEELLAELGKTVPFQVWPVVEAVADPDVVISRWDMPGERPERAQPVKGSDGQRWEPANEPTRWRVSLAAPRAALRSVRPARAGRGNCPVRPGKFTHRWPGHHL
ncbi:hypothetical protein [Streptomyces griseorubiginosus]|uniref:hypothetical protein n=1 Tax=Streptomyces griseorubiginosus TaxID=67304 RepID=UPI0036EEE964